MMLVVTAGLLTILCRQVQVPLSDILRPLLPVWAVTARTHQHTTSSAEEVGHSWAILQQEQQGSTLLRHSSMKPAARSALWLLLLLCLAASSSGLTSSTRAELKRQTAKRWRHAAEVSRLRARSAARHFLEDRGAVSVALQLPTAPGFQVAIPLSGLPQHTCIPAVDVSAWTTQGILQRLGCVEPFCAY